uniref:Uncharacterized protein n=1 Tax=Anopheles dirus TaxID=7168 RepID=A0A182N4J9_9DIPT
MPPAKVVAAPKAEPALDTSFRELLKAIEKAHPSERDLYEVFAPVRRRIWRSLCIRWLTRVACLLTICLTVYYVPSVNWHATAVGRLFMIELLPYWDWTPLYRGKCLIAKSKENTASKAYETTPFFSDDCVVCQNYVVVSDAQSPWIEHARYGADWGSFQNDVEDLLLANPCDFRTNLLFKPTSAKSAALARMVELLADDRATEHGWFVQLRNCALRTVKKTRLMFAKPYFYATHWEPPYTNWMLLSRGFRSASEITPKMAGLVIVQQMRSQLGVVLRPRAECERSCGPLPVTLAEGQSLLFSSTLWSLSYEPSGRNQTSVTFVTETYESV